MSEKNKERSKSCCRKACDALHKLWQRRPSSINVMASGTMLLAIFAGIGLWKTLENLNRTQRAWLAPTGAEIAGPVEEGRALRVNILYENVGREPASDVTTGDIRWQAFGIPPNVHGEAWLPNIPTIKNDQCDFITPNPGREVVYPFSTTVPTKKLIYVYNAEPLPSVTRDFIDRKETILIYGCFVYRTINETHRSAFCIYIQPTSDDQPEEWGFRFCPSGNHAD